MNLPAADFGGPSLEGCNENLVRTRPDMIRELHRELSRRPAPTSSRPTASARPRSCWPSTAFRTHAREINRIAAQLAREEADAASTPDQPRFVAGSMGPTTKSISVTGGVTFDQLAASYQEQAEGLIEGGADLLLLETVQDTLNCKAGLIGIERALETTRQRGVAIAVSGTIETMGTLLAGQDIEAFYTVDRASRPALDRAQLRHRSRLHDRPSAHASLRFRAFHVACVPNAGLPDEEGHYNETPEIARAQSSSVSPTNGWVNLVGGCCGTTPAAYPRCSPRWPSRANGRAISHAAPLDRLGNRIAGHRREHAAGHRRRADQRARQPQVQAADRRGQISTRRPRSDGCRSGAARTCSTSACRIPTATKSPT